eukprot:TRINITY_DN2911_c0_g1_i1.p1 TRINITY_DN2911_c0_g1~~TRINITY_DN2911_c0_g1_i1.p1  ORF type:complete len:372 (+),score=121.52 TRINITY_DN2911_c0_g1_i1:67-1182(+)
MCIRDRSTWGRLGKDLQDREAEILELRRQWRAEADDLRRQLGAERNEKEAEARRARARIEDLESRISGLTVEINRLNQVAAEREEEWIQKIETTRRSMLEGKELEVKFQAERAGLEAQILQLRQRLDEVSSRFAILQADNERLNNMLAARGDENERLRDRISKLEAGSFQEMEDLRLQLESYKKANLDTRELSLRFGSEKAQLEAQIRQQKQALDSLNEELMRTNELLSGSRSDKDRLTTEIDILRRQLQVSNNEKNAAEMDAARRNERTAQLQRELDHVVQERNSYRAQLENNGTDLSRKNQELIQKIQELDALHRRYEDAIRNTRELSQPPSLRGSPIGRSTTTTTTSTSVARTISMPKGSIVGRDNAF